MIKRFRHPGLERFFESGSKAGIQPGHAKKLTQILTMLNAAVSPEDMSAPGLNCHKLNPKKEGRYAVSVSGNWRVTFRFESQDAVDVDYHKR